MVQRTIVVHISREELIRMVCRTENIEAKDLVSFKMSHTGITVVRK